MKAILQTVLTLALVFSGIQHVSAQQQILEGAFSGAVRAAMQKKLGGIRADFSNGWGRERRVWTGETKVVFQGIRSRVEKIYRNKKDGDWQRGWASVDPRSFDIRFRNFRKTPGKKELRFTMDIKMQLRAWGQYRKYAAGQKLLDVDATGRATLNLRVNMLVYIYNNGTRLGWKAEYVDFKYSRVVLDRVGRVGGYTARILGDAVTGAIKKWFPSQERRAIAMAKVAIKDAMTGSRQVRNDVARVINQF